ncbi:bile acid germinant receptor pseudoprotease CspC [Asaccharospora irregularis]|uniref:Subtilase family protein n=1 Tax=Asaccharospora irregularis DSM 2635 TaxID=1121321 RepID=A0A1M5NFZ2_9FIRM|nr:bile acid germinant receptor pseudoprotease CspC [Asaccharospora irregularis]SHG88506.1 Subtilase family protein [Asaccharospora irregularis DSM 2635]
MEKSYLIMYQSGRTELEDTLKSNGIDRYIILNSQLAAIYTKRDFDEDILNSIKIIGWWQRSSPMSSLIEITNNIENGETVSTAAGTEFVYSNPYSSVTGKGVIIGIIDSGIDYLHPDFIDEDGNTKIISIWDQDSKHGDPPSECLFGTEFSREDINKAISENNGNLTSDNTGTGTMAAGICCGRGNLNSQYRGVAIDSELVVVKLREYRGRFKEGKINYQSSDFLSAIKYINDVATKERKYIIINLTVATAPGGEIEVSLLDSFNFLYEEGVILVAGAGNEGNTDIHNEGEIAAFDEPQDVIIQVGEQNNLEIYLIVDGPDKIGIQVISPSGEISDNIVYSPDNYPYYGKFNLENTEYELQIVYPWFEYGSEKLFIGLYDIKPGIWTLRLKPEYIIDGLYDIYLPNKSLISNTTRFLDPTSSSTITSFANIENVISVGAYNYRTSSMWIGSSRGSLRTSFIKPDIVAPGVDIISTYINQSYNTGTGTGISSSVVSGVLALLMDFISQQGLYPRKTMYTPTLKTYLMLGARKEPIYIYPNTYQGYGILDLANTMKQISKTL